MLTMKLCAKLLKSFLLLLPGSHAYASDGTFSHWTMPAQPAANQPWTLVFEASALGGRDLDPATEPSATLVDGRIVVNLNTECSVQGCDVLVRSVFRVEMSGIPQGEYPVTYVDAAGPEELPTGIAVTVEAEPDLPEPSPALISGFWYAADNPGSGFYLDISSDGQVGMSVLDAESRSERLEPIWRIDSTRYHAGGFVVAPRVRRSQSTETGNCFTCPGNSLDPTFNVASRAYRVRAVSYRRAMVDLSDGVTAPITAFPLGNRYLSTSLVDKDDGVFGPLPVPDLRGRWIIDLPTGSEAVSFENLEESAGRVIFDAQEYRISCAEGSASTSAECTLSDLEREVEYVTVLGNVSADAIHFPTSDRSSFFLAKRF